MFARGRSKDRSNRKPTPPQASYMDSNQFANYLTELREKRVTRPGGAKIPGASSARTSIDPGGSAARTSAAASTTTLNTPPGPPFPRADSALSNRTTTTILSHTPTRHSMSTSRSRRSMPPPASPEDEKKFANIDPTIVQPSATYIERGQRWMEREEAGSLRDALEDMDAAERKKAEEAALAEEKLRELAMEEEERIQLAAQKEASELVFAHLHPEEVKRRQEEEERRRQTGYRYHLRKGSYQHARAASVGREYKGDDAIIVDLNSRPAMPSRTFSDESTMRSASRTSMRRESSDHSLRPTRENRQSTDEPRGRPPAKSSGKSYGTLPGTIPGVASKSRSWSARRKSGGGKRNISGEINTVFHPDQIWEEPETSRESSKNRAKKEQAENSRGDMYNGTESLSQLKRNPANRVQFQEESKSESTTPTLEDAGLPVKKIDRFEIFRNPPSQSRNPLYTANGPPKPRTPSPHKNADVPMKDGKEIRNEELRKATTKSLKERSEKLPTPTAVSDNRGRPIVSFDKKWMSPEEKAALKVLGEKEKEKAEFEKNKADSTPVGTARTIIPEPVERGEGRNESSSSIKAGTTGLSAVEIAKRKIFGLAEETSFGGPKGFGERTSRSCSPQRRSGGGSGEGGGKEGERGQKGEKEECKGYFEVVGCEADKEYVLGKIGNTGPEKDNNSDAEVKVAGKWIVETRKGVSTFRIEDEKTLKEQQRRKDGFPYRLDSSANSSTSSFAAANPRPTSRDGSKKSTPRTSISQEKLEADISPVATPLVDLVKKTPPAAPAEPAMEIFPSLEVNASVPAPLVLPNLNIASIAPPAAESRPALIERQSTLMARSPFARPRGESFMSRRSIFQPEKSVPASPSPGTSTFPALENEKPKPIGPSLLSAPRPRPSFLTRTRSRSSVSGHSVFALKKPESVSPSAALIKEDKTPTVAEEKTVASAQILPEKKSTEEARPPISRARSSENSTLKALPQLPRNSAEEQVAPPAELPKPLSNLAQLAAPFGQSLLSAARPRPSFLTRTRSRSSVAGHSVFALKKPEPAPVSVSALPAKEEPKPLVPGETPARTPSPLAEVKKASMKEVRPLITRAKSSEVSVSRVLPQLPPAEVAKETPLPSSPVAVAAPKIPASAAETPKSLNHITNSHLSKLNNTRPSFLTRTRSRSSVAGHSPYSLKGQESSSPLAETSSPTPPAHDEDRPPIARAKSSENAIPKATQRQSVERAPPPRLNTRSPFARPSSGPRSLPAPPEMSLDNASEPQPSAPTPIATLSNPAPAAETQKPVQHITNFHLSAARSRPSFLTRTRSRSSVAGHSPYSLKGEESSSPVVENSSPTPPAHDEDRPPFNRSKSSENTIKTTPRHSIEEQDKPRFAPRSPFARPSLGPTSLSTPPEMSLNKMGSLASRSPFGRPGGARSSMSTVSKPSNFKEIGPSPSVRRSPFNRPVTSHGSTPHARSSLGTEVRKSIDEGDARPKSREGFSANSAKAKLPWMRANRGLTDENPRPRSSTIECLKIDSPSQRPVSRGKELPSMNENTAPEPEKILPDVPVTESPPPLEVTVNTADVAALYQDVLESPTKASEVVVKTADIAKQYDLVLNESKALDEKASVPAPLTPATTKALEVVTERPKSSLSGARPLPLKPSGPRQSAPSARRTPRHEEPVVVPPPLVKAQTVPEKVLPPPPAIVEPPKDRQGHKKNNSSISAPSTHAAVLAPPVETLSEVRPPAPEDAVIEQKPLPTIYGPPRPETSSGITPALTISAPAIAIRAPSPAPPDNGPMISVSAPAINATEPSTAAAAAAAAPQRPQFSRPLPQPARPLPQPGASARALPRPTSSSGHRPLPAPANARPMPSPSSRVAPPPNLARPSSDSTSHWSPAPAPVGARATATCHACTLPIEGRVIALAGLKERWHPACMQCHVCSTALADFEISPEPSFARAARLARIEAREAGEYVAEGEATDGDKKLRFYCHLDWHEAFAPRCQHCKTPIIGEHITALGGKHYHYGHFFCCECGDPFMQGTPHVELDGYAWCTGCVEKRTLRRAPKCGLCRKNVVGEVVQALGKEFHAECFRCGDCGDAFVGGEIYLRDDVGVSCRECMERWAKNQRRGSVRG